MKRKAVVELVNTSAESEPAFMPEMKSEKAVYSLFMDSKWVVF